MTPLRCVAVALLAGCACLGAAAPAAAATAVPGKYYATAGKYGWVEFKVVQKGARTVVTGLEMEFKNHCRDRGAGWSGGVDPMVVHAGKFDSHRNGNSKQFARGRIVDRETISGTVGETEHSVVRRFRREHHCQRAVAKFTARYISEPAVKVGKWTMTIKEDPIPLQPGQPDVPPVPDQEVEFSVISAGLRLLMPTSARLREVCRDENGQLTSTQRGTTSYDTGFHDDEPVLMPADLSLPPRPPSANPRGSYIELRGRFDSPTSASGTLTYAGTRTGCGSKATWTAVPG
jgi:hypothetical protein